MAEIRHQIIIEAEPELVRNALVDEGSLSQWWTNDVRATPVIGSVNEFAFSDRAVVFRMRVGSLGPEAVHWSCVDGPPEWVDTEVTFRLRAYDDGATILDFVHSGWRSTEKSFATCSYDWAHYLTSLKRFVECGEGVPHPIYLTRGRLRP